MPERREHARYSIWFPVQIATEQGSAGRALAVSKDTSQSGISISAARKFDVGVEVVVSFRVPIEGGAEQSVAGTIVRFEVNGDDPHGLWPYRIAVSFAKRVPDLEGLLQEMQIADPWR